MFKIKWRKEKFTVFERTRDKAIWQAIQILKEKGYKDSLIVVADFEDW